jgi:hypothetical protein
MNIGERISLYKERLGFRNYAEFSKAVGLKNDWLLETSKKSEIKVVDIGNLIKLSEYLQISIDELVKDDTPVEEITTIDNEKISDKLKEIIFILDNEDEVRLDGQLLNDKAKQVFKDGLEVCKQLTRQYL